MYTQCPECTTVFRVTAEALRVAHGEVRCGVCSTAFDALERLSEEPFQAEQPHEAPAHDDTITVEELPGTEVIELSTPAEPPQGESAAILQFRAEYPLAIGPAVEMTVAGESEENWAATADPGVIAAALCVSDSTSETEPAPVEVDLDPTDEFPILVLDEHGESEGVAVAGDQGLEPAEEPVPGPQSQLDAPRILIPEELRRGLAEEAAAAAAAERAFEVEPAATGGRRRWPWALAVILLALVLAIQVVHSRREALLRQPAVGPLLARAYALVGLPLAAPIDLAAYELRQWGAASDARQTGRLLLRASIVNRAAHAQPYPLLRLTLQDRFGGVIGAREIEPADYLPGATATRLMMPGQRADAEIIIVDPGTEAVGFEMDVCLPSAGSLRCAGDPGPAAP